MDILRTATRAERIETAVGLATGAAYSAAAWALVGLYVWRAIG